MCKQQTIKWLEEWLSILEIEGQSVIDVGAYNVNGSTREAFLANGAANYLGVDMRAGPGVDVVCDAEVLREHFGRESFDIVCTTSTFEHVKNWQSALVNLKDICRPGGLIIFTAACDSPYHAYPHDYWRFTKADIQHIFADFECLSLDIDSLPFSVVRFIGRKPVKSNSMISLDSYHLHSVMIGQRCEAVCWWHFIAPRFFYRIWQDMVKPRLAWSKMAIEMGIRLRIIDPLRKHL